MFYFLRVIGSFTLGFTRASLIVRRCDLKSIPFNLINSEHTWSVAVIKVKPLSKSDLERTIFKQQFSLRYVVFHKPRSSGKSSFNMLLFKFPTYKIFNVFWELDSSVFCVRRFIWKISCSDCGWFWKVLCSSEKCCYICWLCRFFCCCGTFNFCNFSCVFSWKNLFTKNLKIILE